MMATHNDMDDVTAYRPASLYGIQKQDFEYLARMFDTDHGDGYVFNIAAGIVHEAERVGIRRYKWEDCEGRVNRDRRMGSNK